MIGFSWVVWWWAIFIVHGRWMMGEMMSGNPQACPTCGSAATRKDGYDERGGQRFRCGACRCRFTATTGTPFSGYRFPPDVIALAVRWYLRFRLRACS